MKLIVEMEMPKCCDECPLLDESGDYPMCRVTQETRGYNFDTLNKKMDKCPIKGVLPDEHGDLIDKETAKNAFDSSFLTFRMKDGETMRGFYQRTIDELPVLIAAERKDDEH